MRGITLLLSAAAGISLLAACNGSSGSGFQTGTASATIQAIQFQSNTLEADSSYPLSIQAGTPFAKQQPLLLTAIGVYGGGSNAVQVQGATFTWTGSFTTCGGKATLTPAVTFDFQDPTGSSSSQDTNHPGYAILQPTQKVATVAIFPPIVTAPAPGSTPTVDYPVGFPTPTPAATGTPVPAPGAGTNQYCMNVVAHAGSVVGNVPVTFTYP